MDRDRYGQLMSDHSAQLTQYEIVEGWHFCPGWDGMLCLWGGDECDCDPIGDTR